MIRTAAGGRIALMLAGSIAYHPAALAEQSEEALAQQLANPVAALISVPFQLNYNEGIGPAEGGRQWLLNIQPVIPVSLNADWNLIARTIVPLINQSDIFPGTGSQSGLGDVLQSLFFSPAAPTAGGWIWGVGPALLLPPAATTFSPPTNGRRGQRPSPFGRTASGRSVRWQTTSGPLQATATAATSTRRSCSRSCPTRPRRPEPTHSRARASTTGIKNNGSSRSAQLHRR